MKLLAIDIETTGLDVLRDQILEVGAIVYDIPATGPLPDLNAAPEYRCLVRHDRVEGSAVAIAMNAKLIAECEKHGNTLFGAMRGLHDFLLKHYGGRQPVLAGKNLWKLDVPMLDRAWCGADVSPFSFMERVHHRSIDVGPMYATAADDVPPNLNECCRRAGFDPGAYPEHDALADCEKVLRCVVRKWRPNFSPKET